uniref:Putative secreted protein n=1 Tax=Rhipicephalus microplus TaxID=6941 RepID=A0A6M2DE91_RHIMP
MFCFFFFFFCFRRRPCRAAHLLKFELRVYTSNKGSLMWLESVHLKPFIKLELYFRTNISWLNVVKLLYLTVRH